MTEVLQAAITAVHRLHQRDLQATAQAVAEDIAEEVQAAVAEATAEAAEAVPAPVEEEEDKKTIKTKTT